MHYISYTVPGPVENIVATITGTTTPFIIDIVWDAPTEPKGTILQYTYTITDTVAGNLILSDSTVETFVNNLTGSNLEPYTDYTVTVVAMNSAGDGDSSSITVLSPETGKIVEYRKGIVDCVYSYCIDIVCTYVCLCIVCFCTAPGQVGGLQALFDISGSAISRMYTLNINISWSEPIYPNGVITAYSVTVYQTDNSSDVVYCNDAVTGLAVTELVMVLPFTNYTVSVAASTSAGQGVETTIIIPSTEAGIVFL